MLFPIGAAGVLFFLQHSNLPAALVAQLPISQTQTVAMLAIPLFILAGNLMNAGGVTSRLVELATLLTGHMRAGLAQVECGAQHADGRYFGLGDCRRSDGGSAAGARYA